jgi:endonuclease/exonuclease/phosphatase family metal-dependent hydrolase
VIDVAAVSMSNECPATYPVEHAVTFFRSLSYLLFAWFSSFGILFAADTVSVATLNCEFLSLKNVHVKYGLALDPRLWKEAEREVWLQPGYRKDRYAEAVDAIARAVRRIDADVIVLTEVSRVAIRDGEFVTPNDLTVLHSVLDDAYPHLAFANSADKATAQNVAILSKRPFTEIRTTIPGREGYFGELDDEESEASTGVTKGLSVTFLVDGEPVHLYGLHLVSERGGHESDEQRIAQASIVRRHYLPRLRAGEHVIVVGDLNDRRGQPTLRRLRGFDDIDEDLFQTGGPFFFTQKESEPADAFNARMREHWTYEFLGRRQQLDHVLISASIKNRCTTRNHRKQMSIEFLDVPETLGETGLPVTDHRAVKLEMEFLDEHVEEFE